MFGQPRVAILSTGNEVVEPGQPLAPGQIYDVNRFTLGAVVEAHGGVAVPHRRRSATRWTRSSRARRLRGARADVIVFSGGSSVGDRDLIVGRRGRARTRWSFTASP